MQNYNPSRAEIADAMGPHLSRLRPGGMVISERLGHGVLEARFVIKDPRDVPPPGDALIEAGHALNALFGAHPPPVRIQSVNVAIEWRIEELGAP